MFKLYRSINNLFKNFHLNFYGIWTRINLLTKKKQGGVLASPSPVPRITTLSQGERNSRKMSSSLRLVFSKRKPVGFLLLFSKAHFKISKKDEEMYLDWILLIDVLEFYTKKINASVTILIITAQTCQLQYIPPPP